MKRTVKKFDKKINMDTATAEKVQKTNEELYHYLQSKGEVTAAKQVDFLIKSQGDFAPKAGKPNPVFDKLLETNQQILTIIRKMQTDMKDEQDTSIKKIAKGSKSDKAATIINNYYGEAANESGAGAGLDFDRRNKTKKNKKPGKAGTRVAMPTGDPGAPDTSKPDKPKTTGKDGKVPEKATGKAAGKGASILKKMTKFLKPIPVLGTAIAGAMAVYAAVDGWENASAITGVPEENLTTTHKLAAAAGGVVSDFTFGLVGADTIAGAALKFDQPNDVKQTLKRYVDAGIIEDNWVGSDKVINWAELEKLPAYEIEKIIRIDDWSEEDKQKLWEANKRAAEREGIKSNEDFLTEEGVKKNTSEAPQVQTTTAPAQTGGQGGSKPTTGTSTPSTSGGPSAPTTPSPAQTGSGKYAKVSGAPIPNAEQSKSPVISIEDFGPGWNVVKRQDGTVEKRIGNRNWRNNNPGNIEFGDFTKRFGALAGDPRFAIFPTYDAGRNAKRDLIFMGKNYTNLVLSQAIARYAPPTENNTASYVGSVLSAVGVEKYMKDYTTAEQDTILNVMQRIEGWVIGRVELIEKGTGETAASKAAPTPNAPGASSGSNGVTTPMNVEKGGNLSGPTSVKSSSSGVAPDKASTSTSTVASAGNQAESPASSKTTTASVNKTPREEMIQQSSSNLVQGTKQYDSNNAVNTAKVIAPVINANINKTAAPKQDVGQDRILNYFS